MASNIKKAGSIIRKSFRSKRYATFDSQENVDLSATRIKDKDRDLGDGGRFKRSRASRTSLTTSTGFSNDENDRNMSTVANSGHSQTWLKRGTSMTQSMRDAVGTLRQKLRMSTRRGRLHVAPTVAGTRRHTIGGREARLNSPFKASTPSRSGRTHIKTCLSKETPTRLRHEVESLTSNMQALNALSPNILESRSRTRKTPPLTNGSLKTPRTVRRHAITEIC